MTQTGSGSPWALTLSRDAWWSALRSTPWAPVALVAAIAAAPTLVTVARGGTDLLLAATATAVVGASGLATAVPDRAGDTTAPTPVPLAVRRTMRVALAGPLVASTWATVAVACQASGHHLGEHAPLLAAVALASAGISLAAATCTSRADPRASGAAGAVVAAPLAMLALTALSTRLAWLPSLAPGSPARRWVWLAAPAWASVALASLDPARRRRRR